MIMTDRKGIFVKLQPASKKEVMRIAKGSLILAAAELLVFFILHLIKLVPFTFGVVLSILGGVLIAVLNFTFLCLAIQKAAGTEDKKLMKSRMQFSYNIRLALQAGWVVAAFLIPFLNAIAAAAPLLFPTLIIFFLQKQGKLVEPSTRKNPEPSEDEEEEEDHLESFEI